MMGRKDRQTPPREELGYEVGGFEIYTYNANPH